MKHITNTYVRLSNALAEMREEERGATAVEYGLIVALIAAVIIGVVGTVGGKVNSNFETVANGMP